MLARDGQDLPSSISAWGSRVQGDSAQLAGFLDLFVEESRRSINAGEVDVRPPDTPTTRRGYGRHIDLSGQQFFALAVPGTVPSLTGLWHRGHDLHDGSVVTLEEMFDPDCVKQTHSPGGWRLPGTSTRAIKGHVFGLHLEPSARGQLIAFLRTPWRGGRR
jgi:hypothetical protein